MFPLGSEEFSPPTASLLHTLLYSSPLSILQEAHLSCVPDTGRGRDEMGPRVLSGVRYIVGVREVCGGILKPVWLMPRG